MIEFPKTYSSLLIGLPGVGKSEYCMHLVNDFLEKGEKVVYVTTEKSPSVVRKRLKELGVDIEAHEGESFLFIDIFTRSAGTKEEKVLYVDNPANLNLVSVKLSEASDALGKPVRIIFDSLSTFFMHAPEAEIRGFFESLNTKINIDNSFVLFTLHEEMHDEKAVTALKAIALSVLEMEIEDAPTRRRKFRVSFAKHGVSHSPNWSEFQITKEGIEFIPLEEAAPSLIKKAESKEAKKERSLVKVVGLAIVLLAIAVAAFQIMDYMNHSDSPRFEDSPYFEERDDRGAYMDTQTITAAPAITAAAPAEEPPITTAPTETKMPLSISEFRLDGMEDINNWYPHEGSGAFLDISQSSEFSKVGKSMKVSLEIVEPENAYATLGFRNTDLSGYDGVTIWSYVPETIPLGRLRLSLEEKDHSGKYVYQRMRSLNKAGWIKDTIPFSDFRRDPWATYSADENNQLDIDQVDFMEIYIEGNDRIGGPYVFYLDELNLFRYQNTSE